MGNLSIPLISRLSSERLLICLVLPLIAQNCLHQYPGKSQFYLASITRANPELTATGKVLTSIAVGTEQDVDIAVKCARTVRSPQQII